MRKQELYILKKRYSLITNKMQDYEIGRYIEGQRDALHTARADSLEVLARNCGNIIRLSNDDIITTLSAPIKINPILMEVPISLEELIEFNEHYRKSPGFAHEILATSFVA